MRRCPDAVCLLAVVVLASSGCFAELGTSIYPSIRQTTTSAVGDTSESKASGWGFGLKLGFYLDLPVRFLRSRIGIGLAPAGAGGQGVYVSGNRPDVSSKMNLVRLDVALPIEPFDNPEIQPRVSVMHGTLDDGRVRAPGADFYTPRPSEGTMVFVGGSFGGVWSVGTFLVTLGYERLRQEVEVSTLLGREADGLTTVARGVGLRLMWSWVPPVGALAWLGPIGERKVAPNCRYEEKCDRYGNCTTRYVCL